MTTLGENKMLYLSAGVAGPGGGAVPPLLCGATRADLEHLSAMLWALSSWSLLRPQSLERLSTDVLLPRIVKEDGEGSSPTL